MVFEYSLLYLFIYILYRQLGKICQDIGINVTGDDMTNSVRGIN